MHAYIFTGKLEIYISVSAQKKGAITQVQSAREC